MEVRLFENSDAEAVVSLWDACGLLRPWNDPQKDIARCLAVEQGLFLVGEEASEIVAVAMGGYDGHRGWVYYLAVHPGQRRRGVGREIMVDLEDRLTEFGCPKINLMIREGNEDVISFYRQLGYENDPVVVMSKRLIED